MGDKDGIGGILKCCGEDPFGGFVDAIEEKICTLGGCNTRANSYRYIGKYKFKGDNNISLTKYLELKKTHKYLIEIDKLEDWYYNVMKTVFDDGQRQPYNNFNDRNIGFKNLENSIIGDKIQTMDDENIVYQTLIYKMSPEYDGVFHPEWYKLHPSEQIKQGANPWNVSWWPISYMSAPPGSEERAKLMESELTYIGMDPAEIKEKGTYLIYYNLKVTLKMEENMLVEPTDSIAEKNYKGKEKNLMGNYWPATLRFLRFSTRLNTNSDEFHEIGEGGEIIKKKKESSHIYKFKERFLKKKIKFKDLQYNDSDDYVGNVRMITVDGYDIERLDIVNNEIEVFVLKPRQDHKTYGYSEERAREADGIHITKFPYIFDLNQKYTWEEKMLRMTQYDSDRIINGVNDPGQVTLPRLLYGYDFEHFEDDDIVLDAEDDENSLADMWFRNHSFSNIVVLNTNGPRLVPFVNSEKKNILLIFYQKTQYVVYHFVKQGQTAFPVFREKTIVKKDENELFFKKNKLVSFMGLLFPTIFVFHRARSIYTKQFEKEKLGDTGCAQQ